MSTADYLQPFPSVVVELPADYTKKRVVPFEEGKKAPEFLIVRHSGCVLVTMHMTSGQFLTRILKLDRPGRWKRCGGSTWGETDSLGMTGPGVCKVFKYRGELRQTRFKVVTTRLPLADSAVTEAEALIKYRPGSS